LQTFGLLAAGILLGLVFALLAVAAYQLYSASARLNQYTKSAIDTVAHSLSSNSTQMQHLRTELMAALTRLDAAQLHEASLSLQRTSRQFARTTAMLTRLAYAQEGMAGVAASEVTEAEAEAEDFTRRSVPPYSRAFTPDPATSPMSAADVEHYQEHLRQKMAAADSASQVADLATSSRAPLPDIDDGWRMDRKDFEDMGEGGV
jgi:hypothetical protein